VQKFSGKHALHQEYSYIISTSLREDAMADREEIGEFIDSNEGSEDLRVASTELKALTCLFTFELRKSG
jgi:hypothetical protein